MVVSLLPELLAQAAKKTAGSLPSDDQSFFGGRV